MDKEKIREELSKKSFNALVDEIISLRSQMEEINEIKNRINSNNASLNKSAAAFYKRIYSLIMNDYEVKNGVLQVNEVTAKKKGRPRKLVVDKEEVETAMEIFNMGEKEMPE